MNIGEEIVKFIDDINKLYKETQEMNRFELVKMIYDLKEEFKICNNDNEKLYEASKETINIWKGLAEREFKRFCEYYDRCEKLQQENNSLRGEIKTHSEKSHNRYIAIKHLLKKIDKLSKLKE